MDRVRRVQSLLTAIALLVWGHTVLAHDLAPVVVQGHYDNALGTSDAASQGTIGPDLLRNRALLRPAEVMEFIPGMVVTQHSGDGKANQYFLRGTNLDHGTDFATTINGVPVNLPTHGHSHGYTDLNILIPELVSRIDYRKGPYFASEGDFSSVGSASIIYRTRLEQPFATATIGQRGYLRSVAAGSHAVSEGATLLAAVERVNNNGPWTTPEGLRKLNSLFTLSGGSPRENWSTSLSAYSARWNATDPVPQRLIDAGSYHGRPFGRFDSLDSTDGATTHRLSLSGNWRQSENDRLTSVQWYAIRYDLDLFSNFTYSLDRVTDQFAQVDQRTVWGGKVFRTWMLDLGPDRNTLNTLGVQARQDRIRVGLFDTAARQTQSSVRDDRVDQSMVGVYAQNETTWTPGFRSIAGLRADQLNATVQSFLQTANSGTSSAFKLSPKLSLILGPWNRTELFLNSGKGFHSNDARGTTARIDPRTGLPVDRVPGLVSSHGREVGIKSELVPRLQSTVAVWQLNFDSELVYVGDAGTTEPGRPSQRTGLEWSNHWRPTRHFFADLSLAWTRPRYSDTSPAGSHIVNAPRRVANLTLALIDQAQWSGSLGVRHVGPSPLIEDDSVRSRSGMTSHLRIQRKITNEVSLALDILNLTDRNNHDTSYFYRSRLLGEPAPGVEGIHLHPAEPRTVRLSTHVRF